MNPSPIYQANTGNTQRLYYAPTGSTQLQQIANPNELQNLAQQGLVEVGKAYQQYDPSSGLTLPGQAPATPAAAPVTTPNAAPPTQNLEVQPGVFSASRLNDFYQNQFKDLKAQQDKLMSQLSQQNAAASSLTTPDFTGQYNTQFQSQVAPIDTQITTISGNVNKIDDALRNIETDIRNQIGGRAADSVIQARVAAEAAPLLKQRQAYTDQLTTLQNQRKNIVSQIETGLNLAQQQFQNQLSVDSVKRDVAQKAVDSLNSLIKAGYDATAEQQKAAQDTFKNFLTNVPEFLGTLSQDEYAQLQQGVVPYSAMSKLSEALQSKQNAETVKNAKIFGGADTGYYTLDQNGQTVQLVPPVAGGGGLTPSQRINAAVNLMQADTTIPNLDTALKMVDQSAMGGGVYGASGARTTPLGNSVSNLGILAPPETLRRRDDKYVQLVTTQSQDFQSDAKVKDFNSVSTSFNRVLASVSNPSAAGDLSLIFNYMKMLDPNSVVRESEFATAQNAGSVPSRVIAQYNKVLNGERLADEQRADFLNRSGNLYFASLDGYGDRVAFFADRARRNGLDPSDIIIDTNSPFGSTLDILDLKNEAVKSGYSKDEINKALLSGYSIDQIYSILGKKKVANDLGTLSEKYESGGDPGAIGYDSTGGYSYGAYQLAHDNAQRFIAQSKEFGPAFKGVKFNSPEWQQKWKETALIDPQGFKEEQKFYIKKNFFDPQINKLKEAGIDINKFSPVFKDVVWSTAVQHGSQNSIILNAIRNLGKLASEADIIKKIYELRWNGGNGFVSSTPDVKKSVYNRFFGPNGELNAALNSLRNYTA